MFIKENKPMIEVPSCMRLHDGLYMLILIRGCILLGVGDRVEIVE